MNILSAPVWALLLISTPGYIAAAVWLTRYAKSGSLQALCISLSLYFICNLLFARIIAKDGLVSAYVLSASATMVGTVLAALFLQNETLTPNKIAGVGAALVAIFLFSIPSTEAQS